MTWTLDGVNREREKHNERPLGRFEYEVLYAEDDPPGSKLVDDDKVPGWIARHAPPKPAPTPIDGVTALKIWLVGVALAIGLFLSDIAIGSYLNNWTGIFFWLFDIWLVAAFILFTMWAAVHNAFKGL